MNSYSIYKYKIKLAPDGWVRDIYEIGSIFVFLGLILVDTL